jgi:hypothetical protein
MAKATRPDAPLAASHSAPPCASSGALLASPVCSVREPNDTFCFKSADGVTPAFWASKGTASPGGARLRNEVSPGRGRGRDGSGSDLPVETVGYAPHLSWPDPKPGSVNGL